MCYNKGMIARRLGLRRREALEQERQREYLEAIAAVRRQKERMQNPKEGLRKPIRDEGRLKTEKIALEGGLIAILQLPEGGSRQGGFYPMGLGEALMRSPGKQGISEAKVEIVGGYNSAFRNAVVARGGSQKLGGAPLPRSASLRDRMGMLAGGIQRRFKSRLEAMAEGQSTAEPIQTGSDLDEL
jgi:hypothetical protein